MDEPTSALDPISTSKIEDLAHGYSRSDYTIVMVTHNMQQAARVSDKTVFFLLGEIDRERRNRADVLHAQGQAHGGLHHRSIRLRRA